MEGEVQPLILHSCSEHKIHVDQLLSDEQPKPVRQPVRFRVCRHTNSCGLSEKSHADVTARGSVTRRLWLAVIFCTVFMVIELVGGVMSNSLAILADAAHLLSDIASFSVSLFAVWASAWKPTHRWSYGFHRLEILGALVSVLIIWLVTGFLVHEAVYRLVHEVKPIDGRLMFSVAALGLLANVVMIFILGHDHGHGHNHCHAHGSHSVPSPCKCSEALCSCKTPDNGATEAQHQHEQVDGGKLINLNLQGAYLHILGDLIQSIGVLIGGGIIWLNPRLRFVDMVCTLIFSVVVICTTVKMLRDVVEILMERSPREIDGESVEAGLTELPGVVSVHELHIWSVTLGKVVLSCHVTVKPDSDSDWILEQVISYCETEHKIHHVTVQIERDPSSFGVESGYCDVKSHESSC